VSEVVSFVDEPYAVRLMNEETEKEVGEIVPLLAVSGEKGLVVRDREMFWWPLRLIRVVLQPVAEQRANVGGEGETDESSGAPPED
jgi:hypothetical protein